MIEIDDAGSGSLVGKTCIGVYRRTTNDFEYDFIPLSSYNIKQFKDKVYLKEVIFIVKKIFHKLNISKNELIIICRSYIFDYLKKWLTSNGYKWKNAIIENPLQTKIEKIFFDSVLELGIPEEYLKYTKYPFHFHRLLKWVYADYRNRSNYCKKGWPSWQKYGYLECRYSSLYLSHSDFLCLKCGKRITSNSYIKSIEYNGKKHTCIYIHYKC